MVDWLVYNRFATSRGDLARRIGYNATVLSAALTGRNVFSDRLARRLCEFNKQLNYEWLISGQGEMLLKSAKAGTPVNDAPVTPVRRGRAPGKRNVTLRCGHDIPFYDWLCYPEGYTDALEHKNTNKHIYIPGVDADMFLRVIGVSYKPSIRPSDIIGVKEVKDLCQIDPERIYMIVTRDNAHMLKHIMPSQPEDKLITLMSADNKYAPFTIAKEEILKVMRVVAVTREM